VKNNVEFLKEEGQVVWLDFLSRDLIASGELAQLVKQRLLTGVTSNPTILRDAITGSSDYATSLRALAGRSLTPYEAYLEIAGEDIRSTADILRGVYDATGGRDGFVSFEAQAGATESMVAEARKMFALVDRPNVMIKIPGTPEGVDAVAELISEGINTNITLLFDVDVYERFADAYLRGLESRYANGRRLGTVASVASFFVSRVDTKVDQRLPEDSRLRGRVAIANACLAYERFREIFSGPRWENLAAAGARLQRPLWASTGTKNPAYADVVYIEGLVAPDTVNTMTQATLRAFLDHGSVRSTLLERLTDARTVMKDAGSAGIDLAAIGEELLSDGLAAFDRDFESLLHALEAGVLEARHAHA
jgi:transaldolase